MAGKHERLRRFREIVDRAIREHNDRSGGGIRVVWGSPSAEEEAQMTALEIQEALVSYADRDFHLMMGPAGDPDDPDQCLIWTCLGGEYTLPREGARALFNVLQSCATGVNLRVWPTVKVRPEVRVEGVETVVPLESMTGRTLVDALERLDASAAGVLGQFAGDEEATDHWGACMVDDEEGESAGWREDD